MAKISETLFVLSEAFRQSTSVSCVSAAVIGCLATTCFWWQWGQLWLPAESNEPDVVHAIRFHDSVMRFPQQRVEDSWICRKLPPELTPNDGMLFDSRHAPQDATVAVCQFVTPVRRVFQVGTSWKTWCYYLGGGFVSIFIWSYLGCFISRIVVVRCGSQRSVGVRKAIHFAWRRGFDVLGAVTLPIVGIGLMSVPFAAAGFLARLDAGVFVLGVLWVGLLALGTLMAILSFGLLLAWPLMWGAVAAEDADAFDAISRCYAYSFQRPIQYAAYALLFVVLGVGGWFIAWWFAEFVIGITFWAVEVGAGKERVANLIESVKSSELTLTNTKAVGIQFIRLSLDLVGAVTAAYSYSFLWCMAGAIYLLQRQHTDQTDLDDVILDPESDCEPSKNS